MKKRKQHYVWRNYLRAWAVNDKLFCLRKGKIFFSDLMGLANERDFYRLNELSLAEIEFIKKLAIDGSPEILKRIHQNFINGFTQVYTLRNSLRQNNLSNDEIDEKIDELINNLEEDYHSKIEGSAVKYIEALIRKETHFFETEDGRIDFLYYLCNQYMRTKKMKNNVIQATNYQDKINVENIWNALKHIYATNISFSLNRQPEFKLILLNNLTQLPFITGDQPVINTFAIDKDLTAQVDELELYYPISPTTGILIRKKYKVDSSYINDINDEQEIELYNSYIIKESHEQIYSNSEETLKNILDKS